MDCFIRPRQINPSLFFIPLHRRQTPFIIPLHPQQIRKDPPSLPQNKRINIRLRLRTLLPPLPPLPTPPPPPPHTPPPPPPYTPRTCSAHTIFNTIANPPPLFLISSHKKFISFTIYQIFTARTSVGELHWYIHQDPPPKDVSTTTETLLYLRC